jgi:PAS domain S-box-containing protein
VKQPDKTPSSDDKYPFLGRGGEMGLLIRDKDWSQTPPGDPVLWPQSLKTTLSIVLNSKFPKFLFWGPELICFYNDAFRPSLGIEGKHPAVGKRGKEVWPEIWEFIGPLIETVMSTGEAVWFENQLVPFYRNGRMEDIYWTFSYSPINDEQGVSTGVFVTCTETTDQVYAKRKIEESERNLRLVILQAHIAIAIFRGPDYLVEIVNARALDLWGRAENDVLNKPILEAMPELESQGIKQLLDRVYTSGEPFSATELPVQILKDRKIGTSYVNFVYEALFDAEGHVNGIITMGIDVTEQVAARQKVHSLNEELVSINEELSSSNEELNAANEELHQSQKNLQSLFEELTESEARFRSFVKQAPVGICIIRARDLFVTEVNDSYLELVGKGRADLENRSIWDAIPEAAEAYRPVLNAVIQTGEPFSAREDELVLIRNGVPETVFVDFVYEPIRLFDSSVDAIMVLAIDVTDKVVARRSVEEVEERVRLAVEAAEIGTFDLDLAKRVMLTSPRFDNIFGFDSHVSWEMFASVIHPDDAANRLAAHERSFITGKLFYEARVIYNDGSIHWIRVQGQVYYDKDKTPARVLGTLLDITQFKRLQQQKDDFISIASHELKTPVTSLKASLQLLDRMKNNPPPEMFRRLIEQSGRSMQKISDLIDDLLNVSRASESQLRLNKTTFTITDLLEACCSHVRAAGKHKLTIQGDLYLQVHADEHAIDQIMVNLVNNAVKYAPGSPEIFLIISKEGDAAKIAVRDTGPGIPPDKLPHLFDRYYRVEVPGFQKSGLGLGLYICSEIIKRHGGQIGVESELGKGSTFWFTLPIN